MIVGDVKLVGDSKLRFMMNLVFICKCTTQYKRNGYVRFDKISRKNPFSIGVRDFFLSLTGNLWHMMKMRNTHIVSGTFCLIDVKPISFSRRENVMQLRKISASANILHCKSTLKWQCWEFPIYFQVVCSLLVSQRDPEDKVLSDSRFFFHFERNWISIAMQSGIQTVRK